jgi:hypothetical protein
MNMLNTNKFSLERRVTGTSSNPTACLSTNETNITVAEHPNFFCLYRQYFYYHKTPHCQANDITAAQ